MVLRRPAGPLPGSVILQNTHRHLFLARSHHELRFVFGVGRRCGVSHCGDTLSGASVDMGVHFGGNVHVVEESDGGHPLMSSLSKNRCVCLPSEAAGDAGTQKPDGAFKE